MTFGRLWDSNGTANGSNGHGWVKSRLAGRRAVVAGSAAVGGHFGRRGRRKGKILADNIDKLLRRNPNGAQLISHNPEKEERSAGLDRGVLENGGIWPAVNGYLVWALSKIDEEMAWDEWLKNSRAYQAEAYPDIWYGIWSGPDSVNSVYAKYPGRTQNSKNPVTGKREKLFKFTVGVDWEDFRY